MEDVQQLFAGPCCLHCSRSHSRWSALVRCRMERRVRLQQQNQGTTKSHSSGQYHSLQGYLIEIRNSETGQWQEIGGMTPHEAGKNRFEKKLTGLDPDTLYFVRIKVRACYAYY